MLDAVTVKQPRRVLLADDHAMFREGLRHVLERSGEFEVVDEAGSAAETLATVRRQPVDVLVLDLSMPGRSGTDLIRQLKAAQPALPILVLSMHPEDQYAVRALAAGASAYLTKYTRAEELLHALRRVAAGGRYIGDTVGELLAEQLQPRAWQGAHQALSDREFQILQALVEGESVSAIAQRLHLSVKTVSTHKTNVLRKLHCNSLAELVRYALAHGIGAGPPPPE